MRTMKDSGLHWLGEIPESWECKKIESIYALRSQKVSDKDFSALSVTKNGIVPQLESAAKTNDGDNRKLVRKGDFVINGRSDRRGSCGISPYDGSVSLINIVLKPYKETNSKYYDWLFHTTRFADEFYRWGYGIVDDLWSTKWQEMKKINITVPPLDEQKVIADFLDEKCSEIDSLIADINAQIEKLEQYKRSVITEAVTKGLNPNVKMKDSGIEWIGDIPEDWKIKPLKYLYYFGKGLSITKDNLTDKGVEVISYGQIHSKTNNGLNITNDMIRYVSENYLLSNKQALVKTGDFIFADTSEDLEGVGNNIYIGEKRVLFAGYHSIILKAKEPSFSHYLAYVFSTDIWRSQLRYRVSGVKVLSITQKILKQTSIILPSFEEQCNITCFLDEKCNELEASIADKKQQLNVLSDYKKSLIFEYVTGKKEVQKL